MVLLSYKHLILPKKTILVGLLSLCFIVTGCDKKSERRRSGKRTEGGIEHVNKIDLKDKPCIPSQLQNGQFPSGQNNNQGTNGQKPQAVVPNMNPSVPKPPVLNGQAPCIPGQNSPKPGLPSAVNNGSADNQDNKDSQPQVGVLVPNQSADKNNADLSSPPKTENDNSKNKNNAHALPNLDLKESDKKNDSVVQGDQGQAGEEINQSEDKGEKWKYTKEIKQLIKILKNLDNFYKNAMWTITRDKYNTPQNFFESLANRLEKGVNTKNLLIKIDNQYIDESKSHSCSGSAFELQINTDKSLQKLFVYNCGREMVEDESSPVLVFRKNKKEWSLGTTIRGLRQVIDEKSLGFLITIPNNENISRIVMKPKCEIIIADENLKEIDIHSATCKYWGQQFVSRDNKNETYLFEEFKYDANEEKKFSVKARSIDLDNESNQLCYKNQIDTLAKKSSSEIEVTDGYDDKGVACSTMNKDLTKNLNKPPQTQNLVAAQRPVATPARTRNQPLAPHEAQDQYNGANQPADMAHVNQEHDESDPNAFNPNNVESAPALDPNVNQEVVMDENGEGFINTAVDANPVQAPPVVYRQEKQKNIISQPKQRHGPMAPPVNSYDGQQMDFSSETPQPSH